MASKVKSPEDFWSGLMFIAFGVLAIVVSRDYPSGTAMRMGPGYFPTYIGYCLIVIGLISAGLSLRAQGEGIGRFAWRPMWLASLAFVAFGWAIDRLGFFAALGALTLLGSLAGREFRLKEALVLVIALLAGCWALFIWGLDLPFTLWGR